MLLEKSGDKFLLKFHMSEAGNVQGRQDSRKLFHSPIIKFSTMLVRPVATDKCAFYLLNTTQVRAGAVRVSCALDYLTTV